MGGSQVKLNTVDALTEHIVPAVALHTSGGAAYHAPREGPAKWGYAMVGRRLEHQGR